MVSTHINDRGIDDNHYTNCGIDKEEILECLRKNGFRITKQRKILIDVILNGGCTCCKEVYYSAVKLLPDIGIATAYRVLTVLEEVGAIERCSSYKVCPAKEICKNDKIYEFEAELSTGEIIKLDGKELCEIIETGLENSSYFDNINSKSERSDTLSVKKKISKITLGAITICNLQYGSKRQCSSSGSYWQRYTICR